MKHFFISIFVLLLFLTGCRAGEHKFDPNGLKTGDVIFQTLTGELSEVIVEVTSSPISHCGLVIKNANGSLSVIEAVGPVRIVPLKKFIAKGIDKKYAVVRLKDDGFNQFPAVVKEAKKFLGRPYDFQFQLDDEYMYCSELVYKAYFNATKLKIAKIVKLKDLKYKNRTGFIKSVAGGKVPLERSMITPVDIYNSRLFTRLYSDFE